MRNLAQSTLWACFPHMAFFQILCLGTNLEFSIFFSGKFLPLLAVRNHVIIFIYLFSRPSLFSFSFISVCRFPYYRYYIFPCLLLSSSSSIFSPISISFPEYHYLSPSLSLPLPFQGSRGSSS